MKTTQDLKGLRKCLKYFKKWHKKNLIFILTSPERKMRAKSRKIKR